MMRPYSFIPAALVAVLTLGACSGASSNAGSTSTTNAVRLSSPSWETAKPYPSKSAKMICQAEVRGEILSGLKVKETRVVPAWDKTQHVFSCTYIYQRGKIVVSVKEMSNEQETTAYYEAMKTKYGTMQQLFGLAQGAFVLKNEDVVARKDYKVLHVDVHGIPADFAQGYHRSAVALQIATVIMACWTGA